MAHFYTSYALSNFWYSESMKTKFILHGGMLSRGGPDNEAFFKEFTRDIKEGDTVLWVGFARKEGEERENTFTRDTGWIEEYSNKGLQYVNATLDELETQIQNATAIFVTGSSSEILIGAMKEFPNFASWIEGKIYAGSSAGACLTSTVYYHCSHQKISEGIGLLPIRVMVHYGNSDFNATDETLAELKQHREDLELVVLPECEWIVKEI
jgi:peptidase E